MLSGEPCDLPGPGLDVPVDADGDGVSTCGDRYVFNYWLGMGGDLGSALAEAEAGKDGVIDLGKFFRSPDAVLVPKIDGVEAQEGQEGGEAGGGAPLTGSCATSAFLWEPYGPPEHPTLPSVFSACQPDFRYPTAADLDELQGLWCSYGRPTDNKLDKGIVLLDLTRVPPMGNDGRAPLEAPVNLTATAGYGAEAIVVRKQDPVYVACTGSIGIHAMSTWPPDGDSGSNVICRTTRTDGNGVPLLCSGACTQVTGSSYYGCPVPPCPGEPAIGQPFAIDIVDACMPSDFGAPNDVIFSDVAAGRRIRRATTPDPCKDDESTVTTLKILDYKVQGIALGDFKGAGTFAAYYIGESPPSPLKIRSVRRLVKLPAGGYEDQGFVSAGNNSSQIPLDNLARAIEFDPISGDLFVSEDRTMSATYGYARIWRIKASGSITHPVRETLQQAQRHRLPPVRGHAGGRGVKPDGAWKCALRGRLEEPVQAGGCQREWGGRYLGCGCHFGLGHSTRTNSGLSRRGRRQ